MGPETAPKHLEQRRNRYTTVLIVHGKEEPIIDTFRRIQMLNVIDSATKKGERVPEKDLRDLSGPQFNQDFRLLKENLNSYGVAIVSSGKRGARKYSWEEIPEQLTESSPVVPNSDKSVSSTDVATDVETADKPTTQEPVVASTLPKEPPEKGTIVDFSTIGKSNTHELSEEGRYEKIREMEINLTQLAVSRLMTKVELRRRDISIFGTLHKALPSGTSIQSLLGTKSRAELEQYLIKCIARKISEIWDMSNVKNLLILSEKEQEIADDLRTLRQSGYNKENIMKVIRIIFSIPPPASVPAPTAAQAN